MPRGARTVLLLSVFLCAAPHRRASAQPPAVSCTDWHECQRLALAAAERGEYELFHDLAWRAVQTGPRNDAALMYMLARAQSLSGRPHDALVMLGRLADAGKLPAGAVDDPDFERAHQLAGWTDLAARVAGTPADAPEHSMLPPQPGPGRAPIPAPAGPAAAPASAAAAPATIEASAPATVSANAAAPDAATATVPLAEPSEAGRFRTDPFSVAGIAYDRVSQRFLFGDRLGRKLRVVGDRADHSVDLARAESGGFHDIAALAIDARRGDLWVASGGGADADGLLHKLQLISGRALKSFPVPGDGGPVKPADVAVAPDGTVLVLDSGPPRLLALRPGHDAVELIARLKTPGASSVAASDGEDVAYVAHEDQIARVTLRTGAAAALAMRDKTPLGRLECIRYYRRSILAVERNDEFRRIVKLELNERGTAVVKATPLAEKLPAAGRMSAAVAGDELVYVIDRGDAASPSSDEVVVYRIALK